MTTTITMKDLHTAATKWGSPITGIGSGAAVRAFADYGTSVKDRDAYLAFGQDIRVALRARLDAYTSAGKSPKGAAVRSTAKAIADLDGFVATFTSQPVAPAKPEPKALGRMTKAQLIEAIQFLASQQ